MKKIAVLLLVVAGCNLPRTQLSAEVRAQLGRVNVVNKSSPHAPHTGSPPTTWAGGLGIGTLRGLVYIPTFTVAGSPGGAVGMALGAAVAVIWLPFSILGGALTPESPEALQRARLSVSQGWTEASPPDFVCRTLETAVRARPAIPSKGTYDATLESEVTVEFRGGGIFGNMWSVSPDLNLAVVLRTSLIRIRDGAIIDKRKIESVDPKARSLREWGAPGTFRLSLQRSLHSVVSQAGYELFNFGLPPK